ncbi:MAG TPA: LysR family transcriptional regulator [Pyrinomonadaceae bacterium]|jgi:DNA-binding transcriptional LysR family regulator|nr:LysR family transcriptional regulator [Pyrinomonadaceae bacterium]
MHIETLKVFCDLVDLESFSLAAERNFITQSAVSQQIRTLEAKVGRRLLDRVRGRREVRLTPAGEVLYREARKVLTAYDQMFESMRGHIGHIGGNVKVACTYSIGLHELPRKISEFMSLYPSVRIDLEYSRATKVVRDVLSGAVELGVLAFPESRRGINIIEMPSDRLALVCPPGHRLAARSRVTTRELDGIEFVHFERDTPTRKATEKLLKAGGAEVKKVAEFDNIETIKRAVEVGIGVAILPLPSVIEEQRAGTLSIVRLAEKEWIRPLGIIHRSDKNLSLAAKKFVQLLTKSSKDTE